MCRTQSKSRRKSSSFSGRSGWKLARFDTFDDHNMTTKLWPLIFLMGFSWFQSIFPLEVLHGHQCRLGFCICLSHYSRHQWWHGNSQGAHRKVEMGAWNGRGPEMSRANAWGWCQMRLLLFSTIGVLDSDHSWQPLASGGTNGWAAMDLTWSDHKMHVEWQEYGYFAAYFIASMCMLFAVVCFFCVRGRYRVLLCFIMNDLSLSVYTIYTCHFSFSSLMFHATKHRRPQM